MVPDEAHEGFNVFCRIGFHRWSKWSLPMQQINQSAVFDVQRRRCFRCGIMSERLVYALVEDEDGSE